jgi:hypothetical protein
MITSIEQIKPINVQEHINRMIEAAEQLAGKNLSTIHKRQQLPELDGKLRSVFTPLCEELLRLITDSDDYLQAIPNVRIHQPFNCNSVTPFHSDVLYGHSEEESNYWINLTPAFDTNSLWVVDEEQTGYLHTALKENRLSLEEFEGLAREAAQPIYAPSPGIHTFCCARIHGSVLNETDTTRVSIDIRVLRSGCRASVKGRGSYFRPQWLPALKSPLPPHTPVTTVASLDEPTPVYLQRLAMECFYSQGPHKELVEFHNVSHNPTLMAAMLQGPVIAYTLRQLKEYPILTYPIGFVDENVWFTPENMDLLRRFKEEIG